MPARIHKAQKAFELIANSETEVHYAINQLKYWLLHPIFERFHPLIDKLIESENYPELYDSFYQLIPFGTSGRRGKVGIGPNRINEWTIAASAKGHCNYLQKKYGEKAKNRGVVVAYDTRQFTDETYFSHLENPLWGLTSKDFAEIVANTYLNEGFKVFFFENIAPTPVLSFAIRKHAAIAGVNISASHNPPNYNGKKVYDEHGGQLIPPFDQELSDTIMKSVEIHEMRINPLLDKSNNKLKIIGTEIYEAYQREIIKAVSPQSPENIRILFSALHGTGSLNVYKTLKSLGYDIHIDSESSYPSGEFETIPSHIANPESRTVFENLKPKANRISADLIIATDPDADRMGICAKDSMGDWQFISGNQIMILSLYQAARAAKSAGKDITGMHVYTTITTGSLFAKIANANKLKLSNHMPTGFKYFGQKMNELEQKGKISEFLFAAEDTHGHLMGNYARDKDAITASILLTDLAADLKKENRNLLDELDFIYTEFGYGKTEIEAILFEHSFDQVKILHAMDELRKSSSEMFGEKLKLKKITDFWEGGEILSETDKSSRNLLVFELKNDENDYFYKLVIRPSGTEPKVKLYFEVSQSETSTQNIILKEIKKDIDNEFSSFKSTVLANLKAIL